VAGFKPTAGCKLRVDCNASTAGFSRHMGSLKAALPGCNRPYIGAAKGDEYFPSPYF